MERNYITSISTPNLNITQNNSLSSLLMKQIKKNKLLSTQNFNFNLKDIFHQNRVSINEFDKTQNKHKKTLDKLQLESQNFATMYYKYKDSIKDIENNIRRKKLRTFSDDITQKKVNLIEDNHFKNNINDIRNIFTPSPLLLEGNELERYYQSIDNINDIIPEKDKNIKYSYKLLNLLNNQNKSNYTIRKDYNKIKNKKSQNKNNINKSIEELKNYNKDIKKCLKMKEFSTIKFKKSNNYNNDIINNINRHFSPRTSKVEILKSNPKIKIKTKRVSLLMVDQKKNRNKFISIFNTYDKIKNMPIDKVSNIDNRYYSHKFNDLTGITNPNQIETIYNDIKKVKKKIQFFHENKYPSLKLMYYANAYDKRDILNLHIYKDNDINNLDKDLINAVSRF